MQRHTRPGIGTTLAVVTGKIFEMAFFFLEMVVKNEIFFPFFFLHSPANHP